MRQILVKKTKHTDELSFSKVDLRTKSEAYFEAGEITVLDLDFNIETLNPLENQDLDFSWAVNTRLARLGVILLGVDLDGNKVTAYMSTIKDVKIKENYPILAGTAVETIVLRQVDELSGVMNLNRPGKEL